MTRCGIVAVLGAPNAGKSTLVNALVGQKVAIVSAKAQTTRARLLGIALEDEAQIILADTPGIFAPKRRLDRAMVSAAWEGAEAADAIVLVVDAVKQRRHELEPLLEALAARPERKLLVLNKVDAAVKETLLELARELTGKVPFDEVFFVSALTGIAIHKDVAMTGEVDLLGNALPIGGLKEKLLAALRGGITKVLIPQENVKDLAEIPDNVKEGLEIVPVLTFTEVLKHALLKMPEPIEEKIAPEVAAKTAEPKDGIIHH